jgi:LacI family transcriptional regulator, galactose operon repressor
MATIYDVAQRAGVSAATVSRVLNGRLTVEAGLAEKVRVAAAELDYRPNAVARNLRRASTTLWAAIVSDIENPFFTSLVRGIEDVAQSAGYSVVLCNSDEDPKKEAAYVAAVRAEQMAGVIISPSGRTESLAELYTSSTPTVLIDRRVEGAFVDAVLVDNEHGAAEATRHLIAGGYRRIACVSGPRRVSTAVDRLAGYRRALREGGIPYSRDLVRHADFREAGGYAAMAALLEGTAKPDAVFAANNLMAVGVLECLVQAGKRVPADIAVVGFDEIPWADLVRPSITTVAQPTYELGRAGATLLLDRITSPGRAPSLVTLRTELRVRGSSAPRRRRRAPADQATTA